LIVDFIQITLQFQVQELDIDRSVVINVNEEIVHTIFFPRWTSCEIRTRLDRTDVLPVSRDELTREAEFEKVSMNTRVESHSEDP